MFHTMHHKQPKTLEEALEEDKRSYEEFVFKYEKWLKEKEAYQQKEKDGKI